MVILRRSLENDLRDKVCYDALKHYGVRSLQINLRHDAGWPDRLFLTPHTPVWQEFKRPGEQPRPLQLQRLAILVGLGYLQTVDDGWTSDYDIAMGRIKRMIPNA
jgi:hypothetical protein